MPDLHDHDSAGLVVHTVDHAVVALTRAVLFEPRELLEALWPRVGRQALDSGDDPAAVLGGMASSSLRADGLISRL